MTFPGIMRSRKIRPALILLLICSVAVAGIAVYRHLLNSRKLPMVTVVSPVPGQNGVRVLARITATFNKTIVLESVDASTFTLRNAQNQLIPATVTFLPATRTAVLQPNDPLELGKEYKVMIAGGASGIRDYQGHSLEKDYQWSFFTASTKSGPPLDGAGGPILVITSAKNPFSSYYTEILRTEGLNEFHAQDLESITPTVLKQYDLALVGEIPVSAKQADMLVEWVRNGGNLIAMRPDQDLAVKLGIRTMPAHVSNGYLAINTQQPPGKGLVGETIQFHGDADIYAQNGGTLVASLYRNASTSADAPAVMIEKIGAGKAAVFAYDLARSVVYTRQGNPAWAGTDRDGLSPMRTDDLFYGAAVHDPQPDWVDFNKIAIPQADEQQRLLSNLILLLNESKEPLPRFLYLPRGLKAVVIMTGDDHGGAGTAGRFRRFIADSPPGCSVVEWQCIRSTSNIFIGSITPEDATAYVSQGFEIGLHFSTGCKDWPSHKTRGPNGETISTILPDQMDSYYDSQLANFAAMYPGIPSPVTTRTDCISWGDYDTQPQIELKHGIRLDTNYYYWPPKWVRNRPGLFTGSGIPMRFAKADGTIIDVYQAPTQMTDESGQTYPFTVDRLLDNALGPKEYIGAFTANMHTDNPESAGANAIVASAKARGVPVIAAYQMLRWLDGRNASTFEHLNWNGHSLAFQIAVGVGANGLQAELPISFNGESLKGITVNGNAVTYRKRPIAGIDYAAFMARPGDYIATYGP